MIVLLVLILRAFLASVPEYHIAHSYDEVENKEEHIVEQKNHKSYTLKGMGTFMELNLRRSNDVIAPNMVIRTFHKDGSTSHRDVSGINLYDGHVTGHPGSKVTVLDSNGLVSK